MPSLPGIHPLYRARARNQTAERTTRMATPLNVDLRAMVGQRTTDIDILGARDFTQDRLASKVSARHNQLASIKRGQALGRWGIGNPNVLEKFRTKNSTPLRNEVFHETEHSSQTVHPVNRVIQQMSCTWKHPETYDLLMLHKNPDVRPNTLYYESEMPTESSPLELVTPQIMNYVWRRLQQSMSDDPAQRATYLNMSPSDAWAAWNLDGVVESTGKMMHQYGPNYNVGTGLLGENQNGAKRATVDSKGPQFVKNYFGSNIKAGGHVYAVVKRFPMDAEYMLSESKHSIRSIDSALRVGELQPFRPHQIAFFCMPDGGPVPDTVRTYVDQEGIMRYDGLVIFIGTIFSVPPDHTYVEVDYTNLKPFTGHADMQPLQKESFMLMKVIFDIDQGRMPTC